PRGTNSGSGRCVPVSSANSRSAVVCNSSESLHSPLGIVHAPASLFLQNGPPGWTNIPSGVRSTTVNSSIPALCLLTRPCHHVGASRSSRRLGAPLLDPGGIGDAGRVEQVVLHVDLDQFVVAVELLRHPELRGKPVLVGTGGPDQRGVVAGASYEARERGVHSGTPLRTAAARCPEAVFLLADQDAYLDSSAAVMQALGEVGGVLEVAGWDEACLLVTTANPQQFSRQVQQLVHARTQLHCSVGIGDNKLRAKIASALAKPAGVF